MESKLLNAITQNESFTENGAKTNSTTLSPVLDLFFLAGASRQLSENQIISKLSLAYNTNPALTTRLVFWAGDIRKGLGERRFFKIGLDWIRRHNCTVFEKNIENVPFYNRFDSLLEYSDSSKVIKFLYDELKSGNALCGKWIPRRGKTKIQKDFINEFTSMYGFTPRQYRKLIVGATNGTVVENKMCKKTWSKITYNQVPSVAFKKYRKAFKRNDELRFTEFLNKVKLGKEKVHAGAIFPHDIVAEYLPIEPTDWNRYGYETYKKRLNYDIKDAVNAQWNCLPDLVNSNENILPIVDVSGSMFLDVPKPYPLHIAIALGIYISQKTNGIFKDSFITFSETPELQTLKGDVTDRIEQILAKIGYNTNIQAVFDLILKSAKNNNLSQSDLPSKILILSDMEFDSSSVRGNKVSNFEAIDIKFREAGYELPTLVFWNLASRTTTNYPVQVHNTGTILVSGFSPNILRSILSGKISPEDVMIETLNNERYNKVVTE